MYFETWYIARGALKIRDEKILLGQLVTCVEKVKWHPYLTTRKLIPGGLRSKYAKQTFQAFKVKYSSLSLGLEVGNIS